jgi:hypothetical protein
MCKKNGCVEQKWVFLQKVANDRVRICAMCTAFSCVKLIRHGHNMERICARTEHGLLHAKMLSHTALQCRFVVQYSYNIRKLRRVQELFRCCCKLNQFRRRKYF